MKNIRPTPKFRLARRGESLAEMVVVMSVIVGMASLSWPSIRNSLGKSQLQSAARQVSADMSKARLTAIKTGVAQQFRFQPDQSSYEIAPKDPGEFKVASDVMTASDTKTDPGDESTLHRAIADGLKFIPPERSSEKRETLLASAGEWSNPIIFYPNGRASQASFELEGEQGIRVEIRLNGMTGATKLGSLHKTE